MSEPTTRARFFCTDCESVLAAADIQNGRCGCGSGRVIETAVEDDHGAHEDPNNIWRGAAMPFADNH